MQKNHKTPGAGKICGAKRAEIFKIKLRAEQKFAKTN